MKAINLLCTGILFFFLITKTTETIGFLICLIVFAFLYMIVWAITGVLRDIFESIIDYCRYW